MDWLTVPRSRCDTVAGVITFSPAEGILMLTETGQTATFPSLGAPSMAIQGLCGRARLRESEAGEAGAGRL